MKIYLYIVFFLVFSTVSASSTQDSLNVDTHSTIELRQPVNNIKNKYSDDDFNYIETEEEKVLNVWQRFKMWLAEQFSKIFNSTPSNSKGIVEGVLQGIGILLLLFVLYKIVSAFMNDNGNWVFGRTSDSVHIEINDLEKNIFKTDFEIKINQAVSKNDFRLAIRYYYLKVLRKLSEKGKIKWDYEKTNYDYYQEIKEADLKKQFKYISYIYDYSWYGEFNIDEHDYKTGEKAFKTLIDAV